MYVGICVCTLTCVLCAIELAPTTGDCVNEENPVSYPQ